MTEGTSSRFSSDSEAEAPELLENPEYLIVADRINRLWKGNISLVKDSLEIIRVPLN